MNIEVITTGDEVMQGVIVDTNTAWIAERCVQLGHDVVRHASVRDDLKDIGNVLKEAASHADAVIVTGGLGPTADDLTIEAAAGAFGVKLICDEDVLAEIRHFFERGGRPQSSSNDKQAMVPEGGIVLPNRVGTAPGIQVKLGGAEFFFLPGVPKELYQIFNDSVMPWLAERMKGVVRERVLRCFGIPEASIDENLQGVNLGGARLSFRVQYPEILLKLVARADSSSDADRVIDGVAKEISARLGDVIYGEGETSLSGITGRMMIDNNMTLAIAESCTGGLVASMITDTPGASEYFERGVVTYSNLSKMELSGVTEEILRANGAVSRETAMAMAEGVRRKSGASIGLGITGIAGPGGGTPEKPVGLVFIALASPDGTRAFKYNFQRDRVWFKSIVAATAIDLVRRYLLGCLPGGN